MEKDMKKYITAVLAASLCFLLTACGNSDKTIPREPVSTSSAGTAARETKEPIEITWLTTGTEEDFTVPGKVNYECLKDYHNSQDKIHVNVEYYANQSDLFEVIQMKLAAGTSEYDVISVDSPMVPAYAYQNWLLPIDDYFTERELADFTDTALENAMYDGKLYAPALQNSSMVLCYNTKLMEEAGITLRENDVDNRLTWDEVAAYAALVQEKLDPDRTKGITGIEFNQIGRVYQMNLLPNSMGGAQIGDDGFTVEGILNSQPWVDALTWYQSQVNAGICSRGIKPLEAPDYFYSGKAVFYVATVGAISTIEKKIDTFDYTCVPAFTYFEDKVATPCGSWNIGINIDSQCPDAAADFVRYMTLGRGNELRFEFTSQLPARNSLLGEMVKDTEDTPRYLQIAAYEAMNTAVLRAKTPGFGEYSAALDSMWEDVRNGNDVEETLQMTIRTLSSAMEKYR